MPSRFNVMTLLMMVAFATPVIGLVIALMTYGSLWGGLQAEGGISHFF